VINSKWVYAYKTDPEGFIKRFKARLVAVGSGQVPDVDFHETHSPVVKIKVVRIFMALNAVFGMNVSQLDVDVAYLHGILSEPNYMSMPQGFVAKDPDGRSYVMKLVKSLYGLHQSGREWHKVLKHAIIENGFTQLKSEPCAFMKYDDDTGQLIVVLVYVDDILIACADKNIIKKFKDYLRTKFDIKDLGDAEWILKIEIHRTAKGLWIGQRNYAEMVLKEFDCWDIPPSKFKENPMLPSWQHDERSPKLDTTGAKRYNGIIARVLYLAQQTRPDLLYSVNVLAQFQRESNAHDMDAAIRMLQYLRRTFTWGLLYKPYLDSTVTIFDSQVLELPTKNRLTSLIGGVAPEGYCDASFAGESDYKSRSGYAFMVFGCIVAWFSKKQATTSLSSTEAEINALTEVIKEAK